MPKRVSGLGACRDASQSRVQEQKAKEAAAGAKERRHLRDRRGPQFPETSNLHFPHPLHRKRRPFPPAPLIEHNNGVSLERRSLVFQQEADQEQSIEEKIGLQQRARCRALSRACEDVICADICFFVLSYLRISTATQPAVYGWYRKPEPQRAVRAAVR